MGHRTCFGAVEEVHSLRRLFLLLRVSETNEAVLLVLARCATIKNKDHSHSPSMEKKAHPRNRR